MKTRLLVLFGALGASLLLGIPSAKAQEQAPKPPRANQAEDRAVLVDEVDKVEIEKVEVTVLPAEGQERGVKPKESARGEFRKKMKDRMKSVLRTREAAKHRKRAALDRRDDRMEQRLERRVKRIGKRLDAIRKRSGEPEYRNLRERIQQPGDCPRKEAPRMQRMRDRAVELWKQRGGRDRPRDDRLPPPARGKEWRDR